MSVLLDFIRESNRIEGILRAPTDYEITAHEEFLDLPEIRVPEMEEFVKEVAARPLRERVGMDVRVGPHRPPPGGPQIRADLSDLLAAVLCEEYERPWEAHVDYEKLHPFMDGNGRSGRVLWAWMRLREGRDPFALGFLRSAYYEALEASR
jgi:hypothetical protein